MLRGKNHSRLTGWVVPQEVPARGMVHSGKQRKGEESEDHALEWGEEGRVVRGCLGAVDRCGSRGGTGAGAHERRIRWFVRLGGGPSLCGWTLRHHAPRQRSRQLLPEPRLQRPGLPQWGRLLREGLVRRGNDRAWEET